LYGAVIPLKVGAGSVFVNWPVLDQARPVPARSTAWTRQYSVSPAG